jgi:hypothetical protein
MLNLIDMQGKVLPLNLIDMQEKILARTTDTSPHRANACWSLADLAMEPTWREVLGTHKELLEKLAMLLVGGDAWEKKNAALCFGNLCCEWFFLFVRSL